MTETVIYVQAVYDFEPEDANELGFQKGTEQIINAILRPSEINLEFNPRLTFLCFWMSLR